MQKIYSWKKTEVLHWLSSFHINIWVFHSARNQPCVDDTPVVHVLKVENWYWRDIYQLIKCSGGGNRRPPTDDTNARDEAHLYKRRGFPWSTFELRPWYYFLQLCTQHCQLSLQQGHLDLFFASVLHITHRWMTPKYKALKSLIGAKLNSLNTAFKSLCPFNWSHLLSPFSPSLSPSHCWLLMYPVWTAVSQPDNLSIPFKFFPKN